ncbi:polysaccharide lyase family 7 protein [Aquimarina sp. 2304DJ70-9]
MNKFSCILVIVSTMLFLLCTSCQSDNEKQNNSLEEEINSTDQDDDITNDENPNTQNYTLPNIDLSHWKVTLPIGNPTEVKPPEILNYATNEVVKPFMYNDSTAGALVFYTYPGSSTANSSYSRTELREQMDPGSNTTNWTFKQGGTMKGTLAMNEITKDDNGKYHRTIIMQIHGRLTDQQRDLIGQRDNNAPPILKIYWAHGKVRVKTKVLKDIHASDTELLRTDAWGDDEGYTFPDYVGFEKFTLEVKASEGKMEIILNDETSVVYDDINIQKWGVFENYFKAGNYLVTRDEGAFAKVKYFELEIHH